MERGTALAGGRYRVLEKAGGGGMGVVYRAEDLVAREPVAVKVLNDVPSDEALARFTREAAILARLSHPAIVRYVDHGSTPTGEPFLVMPFLAGETLDERLAKGGLTVEQALQVVRRTAEGLALAHANGVVHRDIKPSNLFLVGGDPTAVVVLDFGIARFDRGTVITASGALIGTLGYMAPEQAAGAREITPAADVFGLGCVLYECLSGRQPFGGGSPVAVLTALLLHDPAPLEVDPALQIFVERMLEKDMEARMLDGTAVCEGLGRLEASGLRSAARPPARGMTAQERRVVTVVLAFDDAQDHGATITTTELATAVERLRDGVAGLGARLAPFGGGGYLVTLASRGSATDQATRAARAALLLGTELPRARIALSTGPAHTTGRGTDGPVVARASALAKTAAAGEILVDPPTAALLEGRFALASAEDGSAMLRCEHRDALAMRSPLGRPLPIVGRDKELALLEGTLAEARSEEIVRAVIVVGDAGIGKSRLCLELHRRSRARWLTVRSDSTSAGAPHDVARKLVRAAAGKESLEQHLEHLGLPRAHWPYLMELAGVIVEHSPGARAVLADPGAACVHIAEAFCAWLEAISQGEPLVLHLEDIHWADRPSLALVESAAARLERRAIVLLGTARPDPFVDTTWQALEAQSIRLGSLPPRAARKLIEAAAADAIEAEVELILSRAEGNPFYLEELLRWRALGRGNEPPESVLAMIQARIEPFESDARRVLRAASVLNASFTPADVAALLGGEHEQAEVSAWLAVLVSRQLLARDGGSFRFEHALLRDACYATLTADDQTVGHRLAAEWFSEREGIDPLVVADHFARAGMGVESVPWLQRAARNALNAGDHSSVRGLVARGERAGATGEVLGELILAEVHALGWLGRFDEVVPRGRRVMELMTPGSTPWLGGAASLLFSATALGRPEIGAGVALTVMSLDRDLPASGYYGKVLFVLVSGLMIYGQRDLVRAQLARVRRLLAATNDPIFELWARQTIAAVALFVDGDIPAAIVEIDATRSLLARAGDPVGIAGTLWMRTRILAEAGDFDAAFAASAEALGAARKVRGATYMLDWTTTIHGTVLMMAGRHEECEAVLDGISSAEGHVRCLVGMTQTLAALGRGDVERAATIAATLRQHVEGLRLYELPVNSLEARVALLQGRLEDARCHAESGMALVHEVGGLPRERRALGLVHAEVVAALGRTDEAKALARGLRDDLARTVVGLPEHMRSRARAIPLSTDVHDLCQRLGVDD